MNDIVTGIYGQKNVFENIGPSLNLKIIWHNVRMQSLTSKAGLGRF